MLNKKLINIFLATILASGIYGCKSYEKESEEAGKISNSEQVYNFRGYKIVGAETRKILEKYATRRANDRNKGLEKKEFLKTDSMQELRGLCHAADINGDRIVDIFEATRIIEE